MGRLTGVRTGPRNPTRQARLLALYRDGATYDELANDYGGTAKGVRGNIRRLRDAGIAPERRRVGNRWFA